MDAHGSSGAGRPPARARGVRAALAACALLAASGLAHGLARAQPGAPFPVRALAQELERVARVIDANTLQLAGGERIRLDDADAPDPPPRCRCRRECEIAASAQAMLADLVRGGVQIERYGQDRERRTLARVRSADGRGLGAALVNAGLAHPWRDGEPRQGWCG